MTHVTQTIEMLAELEEDFQATALDVRFSNDNKANLLGSILDGMVDIVYRSFKTTQYDCYDVCEYVQDFFERTDLARAMIDQAFTGEDVAKYKSRLNAYMNYKLTTLALHSRPVESYRLEP